MLVTALAAALNDALADKLDDRSPRVIRNAALALCEMGATAAIAYPDVIAKPSDSSAFIRPSAVEAVGNVGDPARMILSAMIDLLTQHSGHIRGKAFKILKRIGVRSNDMVSSLQETMCNPDVGVRKGVILALGMIGTPAVNALLVALMDSEESVREKAAEELVSLRQPNDEFIKSANSEVDAVSIIVAALADQNRNVRKYAAWVSGMIGSPAVAAALVNSLSDPDSNVRKNAATSLGEVNAPLEMVLPGILAALANSEGMVRWDASQALVNIRAPAEVCVPIFLNAMTDSNANVREVAIKYLGELGEHDEAIVPALLAALKDSSGFVSLKAARFLRKVHTRNQSVFPALIAAAEHGDMNVRREAVEFIGEIGTSAGAIVVPAASAALADRDKDVREAAAKALGNIGRPASIAVPALIAALHDESTRVRSSAANALGKIGPLAAAAIPALIEARHSTETSVCNNAVTALGKIGVPAESIIPTLVAALGDNRESVRKCATVALGEVGEPAVSVLIGALDDSNKTLRFLAASALVDIGVEAKLTIPILIELLADAQFGSRSHIAHVIMRIGVAAVPALRRASAGTNSKLALAALQIIAQISPAVLTAEGKSQKPKGIERMGDEALRLIGDLEVFYWIGALCRKRRTDSFTFTELAKVIPDLVTVADSVSSSEIRRAMTDVSKLYRSYYKKFYDTDVPNDDDRMTADGDKFVTRYNGAKRQIIGSVGWKAWEETKRYLTARGVALKPITDIY